MTRLVPVAMFAVLALGLGDGIAASQTLDQGTGDQASRSLDRPDVTLPARPAPPRPAPPRPAPQSTQQAMQARTPPSSACPAGRVAVRTGNQQTKCRRANR